MSGSPPVSVRGPRSNTAIQVAGALGEFESPNPKNQPDPKGSPEPFIPLDPTP